MNGQDVTVTVQLEDVVSVLRQELSDANYRELLKKLQVNALSQEVSRLRFENSELKKQLGLNEEESIPETN